MIFLNKATYSEPSDRYCASEDASPVAGPDASGHFGVTTPTMGKILFEGKERACVILHAGGLNLSVQMSVMVKVGDSVMIEADCLTSSRAVVQRIAGPLVELRLAKPPVGPMDAAAKAPAMVKRAPRFALVEPARMRIGIELLQVQTLDISQAGAKLDISGVTSTVPVHTLFARGAIALLNIRGMPEPRLGYVRWHVGGRLGFHFQESIAAEAVNCILSHPGLERRNACLEASRS
jgi:hypothetical protein